MILKPDYNVVSIYDIPFEKMKNEGIKAVLFDLDSTVMPSNTGKFPKEVIDLFDRLKNDFILAIVSNNKKDEYVEKARRQVNFKVIGRANKPNPRIIKEFLKSINVNTNEAVIVGDRPLTDILAGKLSKTKTVLVDSITKDSENKLTRIVRKIERFSIRNF